MKQYEFTYDAVFERFGVVTANNIEEARQKIINGQYDDIIEDMYEYTDFDTLRINEESEE